MRFGGCRGSGNGHGDEGLHKPYAKPGTRCSLHGSDTSGHYRGDAHGPATPSGNGSKFGSRFHGFAYVAKMVGSPRVDGNGAGSGSGEGAAFQHYQFNPANFDSFNVARKLAKV